MDNSAPVPQSGNPAARSLDRTADIAEETDLRLLAAVAQGDDGAFAELYRRHGTAVYNYLLRLIHDDALAEDLLQETFVAVWQGASAFRGKASLKTWVFRIAHNKAVSWLRRHRPESMEADRDLASDQAGPEALALMHWRSDELLAALASLSPNHRAVVELAFVHELAYGEIAQIMDCPVGTVKSRVSYALRHLAQLLSGSGLGD